ncbi:MAG: 50S ribosomal protein L29 [Patescibacteria group bacterium]|nr:50S ribosomal protein L29 [Patescibacteria group bacterium]MDD5164664.1 50S ribosomal protein L29 [Patescibacteria group bacterium]MDD5534810.1 50S ribosomal protein L29 [Patescibacteria group bacterium]
MKVKELRQKSNAELTALLADLKEKYRGFRFDIQLKQQKNVKEIDKVKKTIARILTILKEKI